MINLDQFLQAREGTLAVDALKGHVETFANALFGIHQLNGKGGVDGHGRALTIGGCAFQYGVEDVLGLLGRAAAVELFLTDLGQTEVGGNQYPLVVARQDLERTGERNLVVTVKTVDDALVDVDLLQHVVVKAHLCQVGHTQQLVSGTAGIDERPEQIETSGYAQGLAHGANKLHAVGKERGM